MKSEKFIYLSLFLVLFLFYGNTIRNEFVHDDVKVIQDNPYFKSWNSISKVFTGCVVEPEGGCAKKGLYYRPILSLSQFLTYRVSSSAHFFHFVHLLYVYVFLVTLFFFLNTFLKNRWLAFFGALFFILHPVNSEVVNWVSTASEPLAGTFLMLSTMFFLKKKKFLALSVFFYSLAVFTKESALFFPVVFLTLGKLGKLGRLGWFGVPIIFYFLCRYLVLGSVWGRSESYYSMTFITQITTALVALPFYILKIIEPFPLNHGHVYQSALWWQLVLSSVVWVVGGIWAVKAVRKGGEVGFGIVWFLVLLSPAILFLDRLGQFVFSERYLFIPAVGAVLAAMGAVRKVWPAFAKLRRGKVVGGIALVVFICCWFVIFNRNREWRDNITVWTDVVEKNPDAGIGYFNLAHAYEDTGDPVNAARFYRKTLDLDSDYLHPALINLAHIYSEEGQFDVAEDLYKKALKQDDKAFIHHNLAGIFEKEKKFDLAAKEYRKVLNLDANATSAREALHRLNKDDYNVPFVEKQNMQYISVGAVSFYFPKDWYVSKIERGVRLEDITRQFVIQFVISEKDPLLLPLEYIQKQPKNFGSLLRTGIAEIPTVHFAYVRVFEKDNQERLQMFLFKGRTVVESWAHPVSSGKIKEYGTILSTLEFANP